jgi:uncharacterized protein involved in exopolysaccharide biosynthesis
MPSQVDKLKFDLAESRALADGYKAQIVRLEASRDKLMVEIDGLEAEVARLEAEDLQPLVARLRSQIAAIKKLLEQMTVRLETGE